MSRNQDFDPEAVISRAIAEIGALRSELRQANARLDRATEFLVTAPGVDEVVIRKCYGHWLPKQPMWKVSHYGGTLNKDGRWEVEPQPSSRDDEYYARCRYDTYEEAEAAAKAAIEKMPKRRAS